MNKIEALEQALAAATPGEWVSSWNFIVADDPSGKHADIYLLVYEEGRCDPERCEANAQLIALMKNTLPDLLEAVRALEECREAMQSMAMQIEQMQGMFNDDDGNIQESLEAYADAEMVSRYALAKLRGEHHE